MGERTGDVLALRVEFHLGTAQVAAITVGGLTWAHPRLDGPELAHQEHTVRRLVWALRQLAAAPLDLPTTPAAPAPSADRRDRHGRCTICGVDRGMKHLSVCQTEE